MLRVIRFMHIGWKTPFIDQVIRPELFLMNPLVNDG